MTKLLSLAELLERVGDWRTNRLTIGFTCGAFDLLHAGHVDYLMKAREMCDRLVVAVNTDRSVRTYKDPNRPINQEGQRAFVLQALTCVDAVIFMDELRPESLIQKIKPDLYIKGGDYSTERLKSAPLVESYGGKCAIIPISQVTSTTAIIDKISASNLYHKPDRGKDTHGKPIVFLDRDGTVIRNVPFLKSPSSVELLPGVGQGLRTLQEDGFLLVLVTNQQGIGLGYFNYDEFVATNSRMLKLLSTFGVEISRIYYCPHSLADHCECRKPGTKLLTEALEYFAALPEHCFFIGDSGADVECAARVGCTPVLVGQESSKAESSYADSFTGAVQTVLNSKQRLVPSL
jgi:D-glycero-beta-D-manno-heptose 1-phosphate adenylyltransferase